MRGALAYCRFLSMQAFTSAFPFSNEKSVTAMLFIIEGKRPSRPVHPTFTENLWTLMQRCWDHDPRLRPGAPEALQVILTPSAHPFLRLLHVH